MFLFMPSAKTRSKNTSLFSYSLPFCSLHLCQFPLPRLFLQFKWLINYDSVSVLGILQEWLVMIKARIRILEHIISERRLGELTERSTFNTQRSIFFASDTKLISQMIQKSQSMYAPVLHLQQWLYYSVSLSY